MLRGEGLFKRELTPREWQITELVSRGLTNREVGKQAGLTVDMTKKYLSKIFDKSGMSNRTELAIWYLEKTKNETR